MQAFNGNSLTFNLTDAATGAAYTITAKGRLFQSVDPDQEYPPFGFTADDATLKNAAGTTVCRKGHIVTGGFHNAVPRPPNPDVHDFIAEVTFPGGRNTQAPLSARQPLVVYWVSPIRLPEPLNAPVTIPAFEVPSKIPT